MYACVRVCVRMRICVPETLSPSSYHSRYIYRRYTHRVKLAHQPRAHDARVVPMVRIGCQQGVSDMTCASRHVHHIAARRQKFTVPLRLLLVSPIVCFLA